jgi:hypothetical protein
MFKKLQTRPTVQNKDIITNKMVGWRPVRGVVDDPYYPLFDPVRGVDFDRISDPHDTVNSTLSFEVEYFEENEKLEHSAAY